MIQRIQTLYILIVTIIMALIAYLPYSNVIIGNGAIYQFKAYGIYLSEQGQELITVTYPLFILIIIIGTINLIAIFLFKRRLLQLRLCLLSIVLLIGIYGLGFFYIYKLSSEYETNINFSFPIILPLISMVLLYLAMRSIKKDELLIKSLDRIR